MQSILNERKKLYEIVQYIKMSNPEDKTSKAMKIMTNIIQLKTKLQKALTKL